MDEIKAGNFELLRAGVLTPSNVTNEKRVPNVNGVKDLSKIEDAARQFEGLLVQEMMKTMWQSVPKGELLSGSSEEGMYRDMLNEAVAKEVSEGQGIGVREILVRDMKKAAGIKDGK